MNTIRILSESAAIGLRLRDILYQAGYPAPVVSDLTPMSEALQSSVVIIYAKSRISDILRSVSSGSAQVILLLNPDSYPVYLDRARHAGIIPLLMPASPEMLLDAVQRAIS